MNMSFSHLENFESMKSLEMIIQERSINRASKGIQNVASVGSDSTETTNCTRIAGRSTRNATFVIEGITAAIHNIT